MDSGQITFADTSGGRRIAGALGLELTKAEANWQEQQPPGAPLPKGSLARFRLDLSELAVDQAEGGVTVGAKGTAMLADAALTSSMLDPYFGDWLRIGELRTTLKDVAVRTAQQTTWTTHFDAVMRDFGAGAVKGAPQLRTAGGVLERDADRQSWPDRRRRDRARQTRGRHHHRLDRVVDGRRTVGERRGSRRRRGLDVSASAVQRA